MDPTNGPLTTYTQNPDGTGVFTAESVDPDLIDKTKPYSVHTEFVTYPDATYPSVSVADADGTINFGNECREATLVATPQTSIAGQNEYDG